MATKSLNANPKSSKSSKSMRGPSKKIKEAKCSCYDIRSIMLISNLIQLVMATAIALIGAITIGRCDSNRFGDWGMVYGSFFFGCSCVALSAVHGRQRRVALFSIALGNIAAVVALVCDGIVYFCLDFRNGVNRHGEGCQNHIEMFNSCSWIKEYRKGSSHFKQNEDQPIRLALLVCNLVYLVVGVAIGTLLMTDAGKHDMCQFEEALRELKETNRDLTYSQRARRNRILTQYISQAKPEEGQSYGTKVMRFFGFGTEVDSIPVEQRKIKIVMPKGAPPSSQS